MEEGGEKGRRERAEGRAPGLPGTDLLSPAGALGGVGGTNRDGLGPKSRDGSGRAPGGGLSPSLVPPPPPATRFPTAPGERGPGWPRRWWTCPATQAAPLRRALSPRSPWPLFPALREPEGGQLSTPRPRPPPPLAPSPPSRLSHTGLAGPQPLSRGKKSKKKTPTPPEKNNKNNNNKKGPGRGARGSPGRLPSSWEKRGGGGRLSVPQRPVPVSPRLVSPCPPCSRVPEAAPGISQRGRER